MSNEHPKNHYRFCPRCGISGTLNEQNLSFRCSACGFHFFLNSAAAVMALIFDPEGRLLFTRRGIDPCMGMLDLPGGFIDPGETAEQAIIREINEELSVIPLSVNYFTSLPNQYHFSGTIVHTTDLVFQCQIEDLDQIRCCDDVSSIEFYEPNGIDFSQIAFKSVKALIKRLSHEE